jgi:hypothetical protein
MATYMTFDAIYNGTESEALDYARGMVWDEVEVSEQTIANGRYIDTVNDVDVYYDFGADYYFFVEDLEEEDDGQPDEAQEWYDFDPDC